MALKYLHSQEPAIIHNDITARNILIKEEDENVRVYIIGMGHLSHRCNGRASFCTKDLNNWYRAPETFKGIYDEQFGDGSVKAVHKRKLIMWKKSKLGAPLYIVVDELSSDTENEYEAMWHFDVENARLEDGKFVSSDITQFVCGVTGAMEIVSGVREPQMQGWICRSSLQGSEQPIPTLLHTVKGTNVVTVNVFALHSNGECPVKTVKLDNCGLSVEYVDGSIDNINIKEK